MKNNKEVKVGKVMRVFNNGTESGPYMLEELPNNLQPWNIGWCILHPLVKEFPMCSAHISTLYNIN